MKLIVSTAALADFERLRAFLEDKNPTAAQGASDTLVRAIQSLDHFPQRGRPTGVESVRELITPFGQSAYVIRYAHAEDEIVILRIWHGRESRE